MWKAEMQVERNESLMGRGKERWEGGKGGRVLPHQSETET